MLLVPNDQKASAEDRADRKNGNSGIAKMKKPNQLTLVLFAIVVTLAVFIVDIRSPLEYAHWLLYVLPLLIVYLTENAPLTYSFLIFEAFALVLGFIYSPISPTYEKTHTVLLTNRLSGFVVLLVFTTVINKLIQARKHYKRLSAELDYANKELESFSYSAAHDLRAPLRAMKGLSNILVEDYANALDQQAQAYLKMIVKSSEAMGALIDDILRLSRISLQEIKLQDVDMSAIAGSVVGELRTTAPQRDVEFRIESGLKARADSDLIRIALSNLLGNAWKYTSKTEKAKIEFGLADRKGQRTFFVNGTCQYQ